MGLQGGWEIKAGKPLPKESFGAQKLEKCCRFGTAVIMCQHASVFCGSVLAVALVVQPHQLEVAVPSLISSTTPWFHLQFAPAVGLGVAIY